jgi:hypothetical protein
MRGVLFRPNGGLADEARQTFDEANASFDSGEYAEAAEGYSHLAELAQDFNRPRRVVQLYLRTFESWCKAKQGGNALKAAKAALNVASARPRAAARIATEVIAELKANGFHAEASSLTNEVNNLLSGFGLSLANATPADSTPAAAPRQYKFPTTCPQCGGRLPRSFGEDELECDYCGSVIRAE